MLTDFLPYLVAANSAPAGGSSLTATVGVNGGGGQAGTAWPVLPNDVVMVCGGTGTATPTSVTDTQGHTYTLVESDTTSPASWAFIGVATHGLRSDLPDTVTATYAGTGANKELIVFACARLATTSPADAGSVAVAAGTGTAVSGATGTLAGGSPGQLVVAVLSNGSAGGTPVWGSGFTPVGSAVVAGNSHTTVAVKQVYSTAAVTATATLGSSANWTMSLFAVKPGTWSQKDLVGATTFTGAYPGAGGRVAASQDFDAAANTPVPGSPQKPRAWAMQFQKTYYREDEWPTAADINTMNTGAKRDTGTMSDAGVYQLISMEPSRNVGGGTAASLANLVTALIQIKNYIASKGAANGRFAVTLWQECNLSGAIGHFGDGSATGETYNGQPGTVYGAPGTVTNAQAAVNYQQYVAYYGPTIQAAGIALVYDPAVSSQTSALTFFPGRKLCNGYVIDYYCNDWSGQNGVTPDAYIQQAAGTLAGYLFSPPIPFGLGETAFTDGAATPTVAQLDSFFRTQAIGKIITQVINAGNPVLWTAWYSSGGGANNVLSSSPTLELQDLQWWWDSLNPPAAGGLQITTSSLPNGTVGTAYPATTLTATGGTGGNTWSASGLPAGLSCSTAGVITGTPTASGSFTVAVTVTDSTAEQAFSSFTVTIASSAGPQITTSSLPNGTVGTAYPATTLTVSGGSSPYTWAATGLPAGLACSTGGVISGTPTASGSFSVQITVTDSISRQAVVTLTLTITGVLQITTSSLPSGTQGTAYPATTLTATGGTGGNTWSASGLPPGLSVAASTGVLSGTPLAAGTFTVRITVTDTGSNSATAAFQLTLAPEPSTPVISTGSLPGGTRGIAYSASVAGSGGTQPYAWSATGLPAGLVLSASTGAVTGTPTASGSFTVAVTLTDAVGAATTTQFPLAIAATTPKITTSSVPSGTQGSAYTAVIAGSGGTQPYAWSVTAGNLPPGITLDPASGTLAGIPVVPGTFTVTVTLTDSLGLTAQLTVAITIATALAIATQAVSSGTEGRAYSATFTATLGVAPYTWSASAGLPPGVALSSAGTLSGIPSLAGSYTFTVSVADAQGSVRQAVFTVAVAAAPPSQFDSLIIADLIELLGGSVPSTNPMCPGAVFKLQPGFDLGAAQPTSDYVASLILDGERPFGYRASNRTITLPVHIEAPDFSALAGAYELLMEAIDAQYWTLTWTRKGASLPLILDCFRAQPSVPVWGGADQWGINPVGEVTLTFQALPYGRSDEPLPIAVPVPLPGQFGTVTPVVLDNFTTVTGANWVQSARHTVGPNSAQWNPCLPPLSDCTGRRSQPGATYTAQLPGTVNITGLTALSVQAGLGSDYFTTWHKGPVTFAFTLMDIHGTAISFSRTLTMHASNDSTSPRWQRVSAPIPLGNQAFDYTQVAGYSVIVTNRRVNTLRYVSLYLDALTANPPSLQAATATARGAMYSIIGVQGTARAPFSAQFQQPPRPGTTVSVLLPGPPGTPQTWLCPPGTTTAKIEATGPGGAGGSQPGGNSNRCGGGGGAGAFSGEPAAALTPLKRYTYIKGAGGQPAAGKAGSPGSGPTVFTADAKVISASPGQGGGTGSNGAGGAGGAASAATTAFAGGAGATGSDNVFSGAGGGSAGSGSAGGNAAGATAGAAGTGTTAGAAGAAGLPNPGDGSPGGQPGGGGAGAWQGSDDESGGAGGDGQLKLTYTPTVTGFSTLLVHRPGPQAPDNLSPLVTFGDNDVPNGAIEYPLQTLTPGQYADFGGTYSVIAAAITWNNPTAPRTLTITVKQYEFAGGPAYTTSVARTFTPSTDITNGLVVVGELTLPLKDVAPDNSSGLYTMTVTDTNTADVFGDALFVDTLGQTVMINIPVAAAYQNLYIDEPAPDRDLGRVMGSVFDRSSAISVLDSTLISGGTLFVEPGDNLLLCYCVEGAPALSMTYFPRWWLDRLA